MGDERNADPDQLEHLANLLEHEHGGTGVAHEIQRALNRAGDLGARDELSAFVAPIQT